MQSTVHIPKHVVWNFAKAKFQDMKNEVKLIPWPAHFRHNIEDDWASFKEIFSELCNRYIPKKSIREIKQPPWMRTENFD